MYLPEMFTENDSQEIAQLISTHPLATVVYHNGLKPDAEHVPLLADGEQRLIGHFASANAICTTLKDDDPILAIFSGQDSYISPNWYPTKAEHHQHVPTWNYQTVHLHGRIQFLRDTKSARAVVGKLTKHFEQRTNGSHAWKMSDAPAAYIDDLLTKIVPFEILVDRAIAKSKLSQNRMDIDYVSVARKMAELGHTELAAKMDGQRER